MNNFDTEFNCLTSAPYDISTFPSVTSRKTFNFDTFSQQISALEETATEEELLLYQYPLPSIESVTAAERSVFNSFGDGRFNGAAAYDFLFTRYKALDVEDLTSPVLTATACDSEGHPYTYYIPNSATYYDSNNTTVTLPVFDSRGTQIEFPLKDQYGKYILTSALTAIDNKQQLIYFPLVDVNNKLVKFPFKGAVGNIIIIPPANQDQLLDVTEAYNYLDSAYSKAKDSHSYKFAEYVYNIEIEENKKVSFFYTDVQVPAQSAVASLFAAAIYNPAATNADLVDITSTNIETLIRYYPDRAELSYSHYKNIGGTGPYTIIQPTSSKNIADLVKSENAKLASYNILSSPFWSPETNYDQYYNSSTGSITHTSILDLNTKIQDNDNDIIDAQSKINALTAMVNTLSTQLLALSTQYIATNNNVIYNSGVIDTLVNTPTNTVWVNIWNATPGFVAPAPPAAR
jgi:hypothetical protein